MKYYIGVDVGTSSVRAALVTSEGTIVTSSTRDIRIWNPRTDFYQQSSQDIWSAVVYTVKAVIGNVNTGDINGIGFDATCSLVVMDKECQPLSVCPTGAPECDIIMWMDHRAAVETDFINATNHDVLKYTGGTISLEMEPPKLLWLKMNLQTECWDKAGHYFDLCDFLTWRATGSFTRSLCSVVAKWTYIADDEGQGSFNTEFFKLIGLEDLCLDNFKKIGSDIQPQGTQCGAGLSAGAAAELGLKPGLAVGVGMIDAHCGCLGCLPKDSSVIVPPLNNRLAMISGTSTCHMALSTAPIFVPGVWGPMWSSIIPGLWSAEGGQSAAGKLIDFVVQTHSSYTEALGVSKKKNQHIYDYLYDILNTEAEGQGHSSVASLTHDLHMWPDYHGNRSPIADHTLKGMICGLTLQSDTFSLALLYLATVQALAVSLALLYLATVQALAYGTRHILSEMMRCGHTISMLYVCGGLRKNALYISTHADVTGLPVIVPDEKESVLLGAAILGATADRLYPSIQDCMENMCGKGEITHPNLQDKKFHEKKYRVFLQMYQHQKLYTDIMAS